MIKIVPIFNLKRGISQIFGKKDPFLKMVRDLILKGNLKVRRATLLGEDSMQDPGNLKHT